MSMNLHLETPDGVNRCELRQTPTDVSYLCMRALDMGTGPAPDRTRVFHRYLSWCKEELVYYASENEMENLDRREVLQLHVDTIVRFLQANPSAVFSIR